MKHVWVVSAAAAALMMGCPPPEPPDACKGRLEGDLVISEVMIDPAGTDTGGEWIELFNTLGTPLDLKGLTLYVRDTDGSGSKTHAIRAGTAPARGYFVVGDIRSGPNPAWINYAYGDTLGSMGNSRGVVGVRCGMTTLAEFTYTSAAKSDRSRMLNGNNEPSSSIAAVEANYCDTPPGVVYSGNSAGTPGAANPECMAEATTGTCVDNGVVRAMTSPQVGDLVITEVMASPSASLDSVGEWFEILARASVDLNDVSINTTTSSTLIENQQCLRVQPGEYVLLARSGDSFVNGDLPMPKHVYGSISFADTTPQRISLSRGDAGIDEIRLLGSSAGKTWQLDPLKLDPGSNDSEFNFCKAPLKWNPDGGGDYGSPGAANPDCPIDAGQPDPNVCFDDGLQANRAVRPPNDGDLVFTEWLTSPSSPPGAANGEWIEAMAKTDFDLNGITLVINTTRTPLAAATCRPVTGNTFLVFGKNSDPLQNGGLPPLTASFSSNLTPSVTLSMVGSDGGVYDTVMPTDERAGRATQVAPGFETPADNDSLANRCAAPSRWAATGDFGSPGMVNPPCADAGVVDTSQCFDNGTMAMRAVRPPPDGDLVITEWMTSPNSPPGAAGEYFEVLAKSDFDLNGVAIRIGAGTPIRLTTASACLPVTANTYLVFGHNNDPAMNGSLPPLSAVFTTFLTETSTLSVLNGDGGVHDTITGLAGEEANGFSVQVSPAALTTVDNDLATNRCRTDGGVRYGPALADGGIGNNNRGTPGLANVPCP